MKTYFWIRKHVRLCPSGSGSSSLSRDALAIEELVAVKGCCEQNPDSTLCNHDVKDLSTQWCLPAHRPHGPWVKSLISQHTHRCFSGTASSVFLLVFVLILGAACIGTKDHPYVLWRLPPTCSPMPSPDSLINWLLISFYLRLHVCLWTLYGGDRYI